MNYKIITIYTVIISIMTLSSMIPGGPVETRSFSNLLPGVALAFNIFISSVMILAVTTVYFMYKNQKWAFQTVSLVGLSYLMIFVLDLAKIFPVSSDPMSTLLLVLEIIGSVFGLLLMYLSFKTINTTDDNDWSKGSRSLTNTAIFIVSALIILGVFVVSFATKYAIQP